MIVKNHAPRKLNWMVWLLLMGVSLGMLGLSAEIVKADPEDDGKESTSKESEATTSDPAEKESEAEDKTGLNYFPEYFPEDPKSLRGILRAPLNESREGEGINRHSPRTGETNPYGARARGKSPGRDGGMMPGMEGMHGESMTGTVGPMLNTRTSPNISPEIRQKMLERLMAIALNEKEPLKVRLSAIDAATSAGLRIESLKGGEKMEAMLWEALRDSEDGQIQGRAIDILAKGGSVPPTVEDIRFLTDLSLEFFRTGGGGMGGFGGGMMGPPGGHQFPSKSLLENLTLTAGGLSNLIKAIEQSESKPKAREEGSSAEGAAGIMGGEMMMGGYGPTSFQLTPRSFLLTILSDATPRDDESVNVLLQALENEAPDIRASAISALGNLKAARDAGARGMSPYDAGMMPGMAPPTSPPGSPDYVPPIAPPNQGTAPPVEPKRPDTRLLPNYPPPEEPVPSVAPRAD